MAIQAVDTVNITVQSSASAPVDSPALTGTPTAPTATTGTNTDQIATTAFVQQEITANDEVVVIAKSATATASDWDAINTAYSAGKVVILRENDSLGSTFLRLNRYESSYTSEAIISSFEFVSFIDSYSMRSFQLIKNQEYGSSYARYY